MGQVGKTKMSTKALQLNFELSFAVRVQVTYYNTNNTLLGDCQNVRFSCILYYLTQHDINDPE